MPGASGKEKKTRVKKVEQKIEVPVIKEKKTTVKITPKELAVTKKVEQKVEQKVEIPVEKAIKPEVSVRKVEKKKLTKLEYYRQNLIALKEELYVLREEQNEEKMLCLNDITAINYWMIKVLEHEKDACIRRDSIKQMKSYDKASASSCGRGSMRYIEWHGRIKPYVGKKLFEAEAGCSR